MDIKKAIRDKGLTVEEVARQMKGKDGKIGISQPSLSSIINGNPTISKLQEIANILGISLSELVAEGDASFVRCPHCGKLLKIEKYEG